MKKFLSMVFPYLIVLQFCMVLVIPTAAATNLITITSPSTEFISKTNFTYVRWDAIDNAVEYKITVINAMTSELLTSERNLSVGSQTKYDLSDICSNDSAYRMFKIWIGAYDADGYCIAQGIIYATEAEAPDITNLGDSDITSNGVTLKMSIDGNYGCAISDAGFYIGTSNKISRATKYSFHDYGPSSVINYGTMTMKVTGLEPDTKYYYWAYAENNVDETTSTRSYFYTDEETGTLSLSKTSISWGYGAGNEENVTVTYSGSYSYEIDYNVTSSVQNSEYNYEWLTVTKSGSTLNIRPNRMNYAAKARSATITVTSGGQSKDITVTQAKCGESAPTLQLWRGNSTNKTVYSDGDTIGSYSLPQDYMDISITASNMQKATAYLSYKGGVRIATSNSTSMFRFDISDLSAGDYQIDIYASNSATANDYWSQSPFANGCVTLYFSLYNEDSGGGEDIGYGTYDGVESKVMYSKNKIDVKKGYIRYIPQITNDPYFCSAYWIGKFDLTKMDSESSRPYCHSLCTRSAYSMALSYLGIDITPIKMSEMVDSERINSGNYGDQTPYSIITKEFTNVKHIEGSLDVLYENYVTDENYSPVYFHFSKPHCVLIIGRKSENVYYIVDPSIRSQKNTSISNIHVYEMELDKENKTIKRFMYNGQEILTALSGYKYSYIHQWHLETSCNHVWGEWEGEGSTKTRYCTLCDAFQMQTFPGAGKVVYTLSGTITSFGDEDVPVQLQLLDTSLQEVASVTTTDGTYSMTVDANTKYTLMISKKNHVGQSYVIKIGDTSVTQDATLWLYGDLNEDGVVNQRDVTRFQKYFAGYKKSIPTDLGDLDEDGRITRRDAMILARHVQGWKGYTTLPY